MVTHDPRAAARARRTLHLNKGQLMTEGELATDEAQETGE